MGAWGGYQNGRIPQKTPPLVLMVSSNPNTWAHPAFAHQFDKMDDACFKATGYHIGLVEVYRELGVPNDRHVRTASKTSTGSSNQWYQQGRDDRGETVAALPGTSNHGWAIAGDIAHYYVPEVWAWLMANAHKFGFSWATGRASGEKWHWEYRGTLSLAALGIEELREEQTMSATMPCAQGGTDAKPARYDRLVDDGVAVYIETTTAEQTAIRWAAELGGGKDDILGGNSSSRSFYAASWRARVEKNAAAVAALPTTGTIVVPPADLPAVPPAAWLAAIAGAVLDESSRRTAS